MNKNNWHNVTNSIIEVNLTKIRDKNTKSTEFHNAINIITKIMAFEVGKCFQTKQIKITTPIAQTQGSIWAQEIILIAILRAGLAMAESFRKIIPEAKTGHIGMFRNENDFQPQQYYYKLPKIAPNDCIVILDPMIATGNTLDKTLKSIIQKYPKNQIIVVSLLTSKEAQIKLIKNFPKVIFFTTKIDPELNTKKYIVPGIGDFGDRFFGTM